MPRARSLVWTMWLISLRAADPSYAESPVPDSTFRVYWDEGLNFATVDKQYELKLGALIQNDWAVVGASSLDDVDDGISSGTAFRSARLYLAGAFGDMLEFKAEYEVAFARLRDVYLGAHNIPLIGRIRVGHVKEPFSLEQLTGDGDTTFMERSVSNSFAPGRNIGFVFYRSFLSERLLWAGGGFRDTDGDFGYAFSGDARYNITTRLSGLPWYADQGHMLMHLGLSYTHQIRKSDELSFDLSCESFFVRPSDADSTSDGTDRLNPEFALVLGPAAIQSEYFYVANETLDGRHETFDGYYAQASWFVTGESRPYKPEDGTFGRVHPKTDFLRGQGLGAFEVALRYDHRDVDDVSGFGGCKLSDLTAGANWYVTPYFRVAVNYVLADREPGGHAHIGQARFQVDL